MLAQSLDAPLAYDIAKAMIEGFDRHYRLFRAESARAKHRFETQDWHGQQQGQRERIEFYDIRVRECERRLEREFNAAKVPMDVWHQAKLFYISLLVDHLRPELAETFFNSVTTGILNRNYYYNDFIFVRPAISTEYLEIRNDVGQTAYRVYYLKAGQLQELFGAVIDDYGLHVKFADRTRDLDRVVQVFLQQMGESRLRANFQVQVLSNLFFRNKAAYLVGKIINGFRETPFALPMLFNSKGEVYIDAVLHGEADMQALFSFARAYFLVDMEIPSAYVQFLRSLMPRKPRAEIYNALGLAKQGKTLFYRDFLFHLRHSHDKLRIAPGIKGMVMLVFDLPSFPYVFKVIKDFYPPQKDTTREQIRGKYKLVRQHDRVGRMADTTEYREVAFPLDRFEPELLEEIEKFAPSQMEISENKSTGAKEVVIKHLYIERRMIPLNMYLQEAFDLGADNPRARKQIEHAVLEYGNAIKDLVAANIFPGDMLWKNFGITRQGKVVFYDYDEIEYITDCNFRKVPPPRNEEDEMSGEVWYSVAPRDVFPETFAPFLLGNPLVREAFMKHHADLLEPDFWNSHKERIQRGEVLDVFPYDQNRRFHRRLTQTADKVETVVPVSILFADEI
ncbi:MAG: bifunctional isocitrate dehydrogenase kinase/phosphatase [Brachymonas sp.]|nr:bifunctional isocitrate dehydrogenase kinase/phosphatase [Brachymonas sp.]